MFSKRSTAKNKFHMLSKIQHERKCQMQQSRLVFLVILMLSKAFFFYFPTALVRLGQVRSNRQAKSANDVKFSRNSCPAASFFTPALKFLNSPETLEYLVLPLSTNLRNLSTGDPYVLIARSRIFFFYQFNNLVCYF